MVELVRPAAEKVAAETVVTEHILEDRAVAEAIEQDLEQEMMEDILHLKEVMVVDLSELEFMARMVVLEAEA